MDFLISQTAPGDPASGRYEKTLWANGWWVGGSHTGNSHIHRREGERIVVVSGSLFGPLSDMSCIVRENREGLGRAADKSNGSFVMAMPREGHVLLVTDAGGSIPVYYGWGPEGFALGTLVHHVATASGCTTVDTVSAADYLLNQTVCYPYSWYKDVRVAPPGSVCAFDTEKMERHTYWRPTESADCYEPCDEHMWGGGFANGFKRRYGLGRREERRAA